MMTSNSDDGKSWGISIGLHALLFLIMVFWAAFPEGRKLPRDIELRFLLPRTAMEQPPLVEARPRMREVSPRQQSMAPTQQPSTSIAQPAARPSPASRTTARESGRVEAAPSTPVPPREIRGSDDAIDFMDQGGGKATRSSATTTGDLTRRESREQGLSTTDTRGDNVTGAGAGTQSALTSDPGTLSGTPHSSANIQWDGGLSRNRIAGVLPAFPPGATQSLQIAIRFRVRPDGTMYGMTVLQKGDTRYERAALDAMRTWRFNALPTNAKQADQVGTAVFHFTLR
ncbi:MAG: TonB family protein [Bacteroidota bacterium]|jgi:TonB family protein|nr:TonB family protein [Bacteroidota bacterium]